jgi:hypothetical protein
MAITAGISDRASEAIETCLALTRQTSGETSSDVLGTGRAELKKERDDREYSRRKPL